MGKAAPRGRGGAELSEPRRTAFPFPGGAQGGVSLPPVIGPLALVGFASVPAPPSAGPRTFGAPVAEQPVIAPGPVPVACTSPPMGPGWPAALPRVAFGCPLSPRRALGGLGGASQELFAPIWVALVSYSNGETRGRNFGLFFNFSIFCDFPIEK